MVESPTDRATDARVMPDQPSLAKASAADRMMGDRLRSRETMALDDDWRSGRIPPEYTAAGLTPQPETQIHGFAHRLPKQMRTSPTSVDLVGDGDIYASRLRSHLRCLPVTSDQVDTPDPQRPEVGRHGVGSRL